MQFPYGSAALALLVVAVGSWVAIVVQDLTGATDARRPDLIFATFSKEHAAAYQPAIDAFEKEHGVRVSLQVVDQRALQGRLQSAMQVGAEVPDMCELLDGTMGVFTSGPLESVGFVDLTDRLHDEGLYPKLVESRFGKWSSRGRIFALPHDVHPVMLAYRRDVVKNLGIDVDTLTTWDEFVRVGRQITKDYNGDGVIDHYMMDLPSDGGDALRLLLLQRGARLFDEQGRVAFDDEKAAEVVCWYVRQTVGKDRISFPAGWGQNLAKTMQDATCLFYLCPDWRTMQFAMDVPGLSGQLALMPLPAWEPGGRRTSTWGGTGLAFPKQSKNFDLAWKLAMKLYFDNADLGARFKDTNILPPVKDAWSQPEFDEPDPFFGGQQRGRAYIALADEVPDEPAHTYMTSGIVKLSEAFQNVSIRYQQRGDEGLEAYALAELKRCADQMRTRVARNVFLQPQVQPQTPPQVQPKVGADR
jgi:arabinosaccharide transport system substrate-binding protein